MMKKTKTARTSLPALEGHKLTQLTNDELRRTVGGLLTTITSGQCTTNCDDWGDCD
jgi:hypothetical protein